MCAFIELDKNEEERDQKYGMINWKKERKDREIMKRKRENKKEI